MAADIVREVAVKVGMTVDKPSFAAGHREIEGGIKGTVAKIREGWEKNEKSIEKMKKSMEALKASAGTGEVSEGMGKVMGLVSSIFSGPLGIGIAVTGAAAGLGMLGAKVAKSAAEIRKSSTMAGVDAQSYQEIAFAAHETGVDAESLTAGLGKLSRSMYNASKGNHESQKTFDALGISVKDGAGKLRPTQAVLMDIAEKFKKMPDGAQKVALAMEVFGRGGASMLPMLSKGAEGLQELGHEAHMFGVTTDEETMKVAASFTKTAKQVSATWEGLMSTLGSAVLPSLLEMVRETAKTLAKVQDITNYAAGRASKRGFMDAQKLGPQAAEEYYREVILKGGKAMPNTGIVMRPNKTRDLKEQMEGALYDPEKREEFLKQFPAHSPERTAFKQYSAAHAGTQGKSVAHRWSNLMENLYEYVPGLHQTTEEKQKRLAHSYYGEGKTYALGTGVPREGEVAREGAYTPMPGVPWAMPEAPSATSSPAVAGPVTYSPENHVTVTVTTTGGVDAKQVATIVAEKMDEQSRAVQASGY